MFLFYLLLLLLPHLDACVEKDPTEGGRHPQHLIGRHGILEDHQAPDQGDAELAVSHHVIADDALQRGLRMDGRKLIKEEKKKCWLLKMSFP